MNSIASRILKTPEGPSEDQPWIELGPGSRKRTRAFSNGLLIEEIDRKCPDCGKPWPDMFVVHDPLWKEFGVGKGVICLGCFESRMGRKLIVTDLKPCGANAIALQIAGQPDIAESEND